jgi:iron complex outermembrane receptor protein
MIRNNRLITAAVLAAISKLAMAEEVTLELKEVSVKATATENTALNLKQPNSTASRLGLNAIDIPASIETLDIQTVRMRGDSNIHEAVSRTTGISDISNLGAGVSYSARGFTGNDSVGQAEDGVRLLTAAGTLTYPSDTWGYENIEILRGPASVLFGDGTVGGIVNSIRKAPSRESSVEALIGIGSRGEYRAGIGGTGAVGEIGAFRADASVTGGNGYVNHGEHDSQKIMTNLLLTPTDNLHINFTLDHSDESPSRYTGIPLRNGHIDSSLRDQNYNISNGIQNFTEDRVRAKAEWQLSDELKLTNVSYWFNAHRHWRNVEYFSIDDATNTVDRSGYTEIKHQQKQIGNRFELASIAEVFGHKNRWAIGYEVARVDFKYFDNFYNDNDPNSNVAIKNPVAGTFLTIDPTALDFVSKTVQHSLFVEDAFDVSSKLKLSAGLRQDWINVEHDSRLTTASLDKDYSPFAYRVGAVYQTTPSTAFYGQFSKGSDPVTSIVTLRPSRGTFSLTSAQQTELGIKHVLPNAKGEVTFAVYHIAKDNILTRDPNNANLRVQGGKQSSRGVELSATLLPVDHWRTDLNMALVIARFDELIEAVGDPAVNFSRAGNTPSDVPERIANAWLYYQQPSWEAGIGARMVGKRYADNANTSVMPGYTVYDANAAWRVNPKTTLRASLRNLTDKLYAPVAYDTFQFILGESRRVELSAELSF